MARIRSIHPGAPLDEDVASMTIWARYLWNLLPCHADREGRLKDSAFTLKAAVFPGDDVDVDILLGELAARQMIVRYEVGGRRFIQIRSFARYQNPHKKETPSVIPAQTQVGDFVGDGELPGSDGELLGSDGEDPEADGIGPAIRSDLDQDPVRSGSIARARAEGAPDLCRVFGAVRAREVGGIEWQAVPGENAARRSGEMRLLLAEDSQALADVEPTMTLLFKNAHRGDYAKGGEILKSPNYAFAVWCTEFPALREQLRGIAPARRAARSVVASTDRKIAELRTYAEKGATAEELASIRDERRNAGST